MVSELSRSLVDAAAEAIERVDEGLVDAPEAFFSNSAYGKQAVAAVAAVLETLAAYCDPVPVGDGATSQALLANTELRRLAAEVKEEQP